MHPDARARYIRKEVVPKTRKRGQARLSVLRKVLNFVPKCPKINLLTPTPEEYLYAADPA
jgi:hypothetical protein